MPTPDERVVRTTLERAEYERFRAVASAEGLTIDEALRRAVASYVEDAADGLDDDPLFTVIDQLEDVGDRTSAREMDVDLYESRWKRR